ncbi:MAG: 30S ribosome-binding factor RbfA [Candidatus Neomarinimicrobiota bacterium]|nr:MAG: 30S ribosome-binding factor RbfA [Candidatus Neomarinimicrobiota bacterium]
MNIERPYRRVDRVGAQILEILAEISTKHIDISHLGFITFTRVDLTPDFQKAHIFFSVLQPQFPVDEIVLEMNDLAKSFRRFLAPELHIKTIPALVFEYDDSFDRLEHLDALFKQIHEQDDSRVD